MSETIHVDMNPQLECAETLASRFYTDPAMLQRERERIHKAVDFSEQAQQEDKL